MVDTSLLVSLECRHGIDISFDVRTGVKGIKDLRYGEEDFIYAPNVVSLAEELQRLFDLTPKGSLIDDPTYGIDWEFIGKPSDPAVACGLTKLAVLWALQHPSFKSRFRVKRLDAQWRQNTPNAIWIRGLLELYGYESLQYMQFGPYALRYFMLGQTAEFG